MKTKYIEFIKFRMVSINMMCYSIQRQSFNTVF